MDIKEFNERMIKNIAKDDIFRKAKEVTFLFYNDDDELKFFDSYPIEKDLFNNFMDYVSKVEKVHHIKIEAISDVMKMSRNGELKLNVTVYEKEKINKKLTIEEMLDQGYSLRQIQQIMKGD